MDIFLPLINNVALLGLTALIYSATPGLEEDVNRWARSLILGVSLGSASALVMLIPIEIAPGIIYDTRAGPLLMSGILGGPLAAAVAAIPPIVMRTSLGGIGAFPGAIGIAIFALFSILAWYVLQRRTFKYPFVSLLVYAAIAAAASMPTVFLLDDRALAWRLFINFTPVAVIAAVSGVAILALLIAMETRRRALVRSLRESETAAREALAVRNRFIAMMSHEVRTPLNAILGNAQLLRDAGLDKPQTHKLDQLTAAAKTLLRMIDDILHVSLAKNVSDKLDAAPLSLPDLIEDALSEFRREASFRNIELKIGSAGIQNVMVEADGSRLRRCLVNILSNAVKFTDNGHVSVEAVVEEVDGREMLSIVIADTGVGMDEENVALIFEPFERLGVTAVSGAGLGMAVVRVDAEAMGGDVVLTSARGVGTTARLEIPTTTRGPAPQPADASGDVSTGGTIHYTPAKSDLRILVVDDIEINRDIARALLEQIGCKTASASNGLDAVTAVRSNTFDAVLMDIEMPKMDGLEATRELRSERSAEPARSVPIVALTAYVSREDMSACLEAGMNGYLAKPVDKASLYDALRRVGVLQTTANTSEIAPPEVKQPVADAEPAFSEERYAALAKLVPPETLTVVLAQASEQISALSEQIESGASALEEKRQALHKLVSIAGNIGLLHLSALSRRYQDTIRSGGAIGDAEIQAIRAAVSDAVAKISDLLSADKQST